jgi:cytosine deaminase
VEDLQAQLQAAGVEVAIGGDNVRDPWYPGGDFDPVELLRQAPLLSHQLPWRRQGLAPFTCEAARLLGLPWDGVLREGSPADLVVLGATGWGELLARPPRRRVLRCGQWLPPPPQEEPSPLLMALEQQQLAPG